MRNEMDIDDVIEERLAGALLDFYASQLALKNGRSGERWSRASAEKLALLRNELVHRDDSADRIATMQICLAAKDANYRKSVQAIVQAWGSAQLDDSDTKLFWAMVRKILDRDADSDTAVAIAK